MAAITKRFINAHRTYDAVVNMVQSGRRGAYVRFSDGEACILSGLSGVDKHQDHTPELEAGLREAAKIIHMDYLVAPAIIAREEMDPKVKKAFPLTRLRWKEIKKHEIFPQSILYSMFWLHGPLCYDHAKAINFLYLVQSKRVGVVCGDHIATRRIARVFGPGTIEIRGNMKCSAPLMDTITEQMREATKKYSIQVWLMALGAPAKVIQARLWVSSRLNTVTVDIGSAIEALTGSPHGKGWSWIKNRLDRAALNESLDKRCGPCPIK